MEGKYYVQKKDEPFDKHTHVIFSLDDGRELRYHDTRKFGRMELVKRGDYKDFRGLGPEPFDPEFDLTYCKGYLSGKRLPIKAVLLEQSFVAGIGNIYADEILFKTGIDPRTQASKLLDEDIEKLIIYTKKILNKAIDEGGTTIRSYTSSLGVTGRFQNELAVHTQKVCPLCGGEIKKIKVQGRGTYFCPVCQKLR